MAENQLHQIIIDGIKDIRSDLKENTKKTSEISEEVVKMKSSLMRIESFKNGNVLFQEKVNQHILDYDKAKIIERLDKVEKSHNEEVTDKRRNLLEVIKHGTTVTITLLAGWIGLNLNK